MVNEWNQDAPDMILRRETEEIIEFMWRVGMRFVSANVFYTGVAKKHWVGVMFGGRKGSVFVWNDGVRSKGSVQEVEWYEIEMRDREKGICQLLTKERKENDAEMMSVVTTQLKDSFVVTGGENNPINMRIGVTVWSLPWVWKVSDSDGRIDPSIAISYWRARINRKWWFVYGSKMTFHYIVLWIISYTLNLYVVRWEYTWRSWMLWDM